jgi:glycosyltransferase involved in cell wall biosynthesis
LPCISTTVGGVPSTVTDGYDALLVPPKDARALTRAIKRVAGDGELRRVLIRNGLAAASTQTLDRFVAVVLGALKTNAPAETVTVLQE